jgi:hypothetical protein
LLFDSIPLEELIKTFNKKRRFFQKIPSFFCEVFE